MTCWHCGRAVELPTAQAVSHRETCPHCDSDLHVCRNCRHYDPRAHHECRENQAEWVRDKDRNNHCDYFSPDTGGNAAGARAPGKPVADDARSAFDRLFKN